MRTQRTDHLALSLYQQAYSCVGTSYARQRGHVQSRWNSIAGHFHRCTALGHFHAPHHAPHRIANKQFAFAIGRWKGNSSACIEGVGLRAHLAPVLDFARTDSGTHPRAYIRGAARAIATEAVYFHQPYIAQLVSLHLASEEDAAVAQGGDASEGVVALRLVYEALPEHVAAGIGLHYPADILTTSAVAFAAGEQGTIRSSAASHNPSVYAGSKPG